MNLYGLKATFRRFVLTFAGLAWLLNAAPVQGDWAEELARYPRILVDLRGSRSGTGDVAASYLTYQEWIERGHYTGHVTFVGSETELRILRQLTSGALARNPRVSVIHSQDLKAEPPADLYVQFASQTSRALHAPEIQSGAVPLKPHAPVLIQTVLGNTENRFSPLPYGSVSMGSKRYWIQPAGLSQGKSGVYFDPVAQALAGKSVEEVRARVLSEVERLPPTSETRDAMIQILQKKMLPQAEIGLVYGISMERTHSQFREYIEGLVREHQRSGRTFVLMTPSRFDERGMNHLKKSAEFVSLARTSVDLMLSDKPITLLTTETLPHPLFVSLMAYSQIPPVIAGDGAMSAALALKKPFVMTEVPWNRYNLEDVSRDLIRTATHPDQKSLIEDIFLNKNLSRALELSAVAAEFKALGENTPTLSDHLFDSLRAARESQIPGPLLKKIQATRDPALRFSIALQEAKSGDPVALRWVDRAIEGDPLHVGLLLQSEPTARPSLLERKVQQTLLKQMITSVSDDVFRESFYDYLHDARLRPAFREELIRKALLSKNAQLVAQALDLPLPNNRTGIAAALIRIRSEFPPERQRPLLLQLAKTGEPFALRYLEQIANDASDPLGQQYATAALARGPGKKCLGHTLQSVK